ncbi:hypothetical protein J6590_060199 [Homalodisca vitripennis]|nr:hypothetical protein J6590_060199 [Homalodisca vitripennis]
MTFSRKRSLLYGILATNSVEVVADDEVARMWELMLVDHIPRYWLRLDTVYTSFDRLNSLNDNPLCLSYG